MCVHHSASAAVRADCGDIEANQPATTVETGPSSATLFAASPWNAWKKKCVIIRPAIADKMMPASSDIGISRGLTTRRRKNP